MEKPKNHQLSNAETAKDLLQARQGSAPRTKRNVFVLELSREAEKIKISGYERDTGEQKTIRHYQEVKADFEKIDQYNAEVISLLNRASQKGHVSADILNKLKATGQLLYDEVFSLQLKQKLAATTAEDMVISIDDNLVSIPWELLYDGKSFFCIRFNMGRLVSTRQAISEISSRRIGLPLKMLIMSDPQGNLRSAHQEGYSIRDNLMQVEDIVNVNVRSSDVTSTFALENIRNFDIVHYTGHADYDKTNPSDSGFLMSDRKLKASEIINLIGQNPLPSLVFSNACKSGHTDTWKVAEDYGREIYGLANAFLLAGVNHYVGTFWDVQDEPGLHFAMYFYKELMEGAMIGEAVRKARLGLIKRYGEATVIWSSYMLYGDPTFRYVDLSRSAEDKTLIEEAVEGEPVEALRGAVRSINDVAPMPVKKYKGMLIISFSVLVLAVIVAWAIFRTKPDIPVQRSSVNVGISNEAKDKKINELVASLISAYNEQQKTGHRPDADTVKNRPLTMVFMNVKYNGINDSDKDYILAKIADHLQGSKKMQIVEREVMEKLLEELKLSSSNLTDPSTALRVGKILSARLISTGNILREGNDWQINLRMIETETTLVKAAITETISAENKDEVAERLSRDILNKIAEEYK